MENTIVFNSIPRLERKERQKMGLRSKEISKLRDLDLQRGIFEVSQSFHSEFRDSAWIIVRNLAFQLSEGDIMTVFEQYGTIVAMELIRDKETGISKGTAVLQYEDARSAVLAVDNFNSVSLLGRTISVDHLRYKDREDSNLVDPRTKVPARLAANEMEGSRPVFDEGSASSTEDVD
jgi:RNA-binding motif X-linked protein 2